MTRLSGINNPENLPFDSDFTLASGAGPLVVSCTFDALANADDIAFGIRNASQSVTTGTYPGNSPNSIGLFSDGRSIVNSALSPAISGGFSAGDQCDMQIDRSVSPPTVRWRKNGGSWSATIDITGLGAGVITAWATTWTAGNAITLVGAGGGAIASNLALMGIG